jgi:spermidine/putrescine transport system ATP-binding protein
MEQEPILRLDRVSMAYDGHQVLHDIDLSVRPNEFLTILGPSGCGKTTILRLLGGFEKPNNGRIFFGQDDITETPPFKRHLNTVFQKYSLFTHLNIYENIAFGLRISKKPENEIRERVGRMLDLVNLTGFEKREVNSLSGGQQQRIAIARALVNEPKVLLLDEPLGALDLNLRKEMQLELKRMQERVGITFVYVTHDQEEALTMSDSIIVMDKGRIQQTGTPQDIYNEPVNVFTARFIGESNIFPGTMPADRKVSFAGKHFDCVDPMFEEGPDVHVVIRPEDIAVTTPRKGFLKGQVRQTVFKGVHYEMVVGEKERQWIIHSTKGRPEGTEVGLCWEPEDIHVMLREEPLPGGTET